MAGIEDSSGQEMKKKHAVGRIEDAEGMRSRADSRVLTVTPRDQLMEVTGHVT